VRSKPKDKRARLAPGHGWRAQPHHKILVIDRGAVRIDYPDTWFVEFTEDCAKVYDKKPPDDDCVFGVSYHYWPAVGRALSVGTLVRKTIDDDERSFIAVEGIVEEARMDLSLAWGQGTFIDSREKREACSRLCLARRDEIQALLTFDFWLTDLARCDPRWHAFLASLQLAEWVEDPLRGPVLA
jgi:hypothetical protein